MTETESDTLIRCPGCKHFVKHSNLDAHYESGHKTNVENVDIGEAKGAVEQKVKWYVDIFDMIHDYPRAWLYSTIIAFFLGYAAEYYFLLALSFHR